MRRLTLALLGVAALAAPALAQPGPAAAPMTAIAPAAPMTAAERKAVIEDLARKLEDNFVFPDVATKYAAMLRANLAKGAYDQITDPDRISPSA